MDDEKIKELEERLNNKQSDRNYNFFRPVGQFIEHVDTINFSMDKDGNFHFENIGQVNSQLSNNSNSQQEKTEENVVEEELFHFIHPAVDRGQERKIHDEVKRLVSTHSIQEICSYLKKMSVENRILLPQNQNTAYNELIRMGMPSSERYTFKTFQKYYRK